MSVFLLLPFFCGAYDIYHKKRVYLEMHENAFSDRDLRGHQENGGSKVLRTPLIRTVILRS